LQYFKGAIAGGGINKKPLDPMKNTEYGYSSLAEGKAYQLKAEYEGELNQSASNAIPMVSTAHADAGNPTIAYVRGNFGGITAKVTVGSAVYVIAVPSILTNTGTVSVPIEIRGNNALSGTLVFNGKALKSASSFNPNSVVFTGSKTQSNPSGLPSSSTDMLSMMVAMRNAYSTSDIRGNQNIAALVATTDSGALLNFATSVVVAQFGGSVGTSSSGTGPTSQSGSCTGLPSGAVFANGTTTYSTSSAATLNSATAGYASVPES
jgi:hypothetical protein